MNNKNVTIYVSDGCNKCNDLLAQLDEWNVFYQIKNISKQREHLYELQKLGIYGTPATFIEGEYRAILGFQKNKIRQALSIKQSGFTIED